MSSISTPTSLILRADAEAAIAKEKKFEPTMTYRGRVLLFLDFDGVLHSYISYYNGINQFEKMPFLVNILKKLPNVQVVVSSAWAKKRTLDTLRQFFPDAIKERIIGGVYKQTDNRGNDVKTYMKNHGEVGPWIAVDDMAIFDPTDPVVWTDWSTGLTEETANVLMKALKSPIEFADFRKKDK